MKRYKDHLQPETNEGPLDYLLRSGSGLGAAQCCAAGVESETCPDCDRGSVPYFDGEGNEIGQQPCQRCNGSGVIEKAKPQHNSVLGVTRADKPL